MNDKQKQKRILKLADFVEKLPPERFDFTLFSNRHGTPSLGHACGTVGCALGWATAMPLFRRLGLRFNRFGDLSVGRKSRRSALVDLFGVSGDTYTRLFFYDFFGRRPGFLGVSATNAQWAAHARAIYAELQEGAIS